MCVVKQIVLDVCRQTDCRQTDCRQTDCGQTDCTLRCRACRVLEGGDKLSHTENETREKARGQKVYAWSRRG